jgi:hypothetical protein
LHESAEKVTKINQSNSEAQVQSREEENPLNCLSAPNPKFSRPMRSKGCQMAYFQTKNPDLGKF